MRIIAISSLLLITSFAVNGQENKTSVLQNLEKGNSSVSEMMVTATTKASTRLFGDKLDLTSVITLVPSGTEVNVIGSDSTFLKITFEDTTGYIFKRHAIINASGSNARRETLAADETVPSTVTQSQPQVSRFTELENKYGTSMAARLVAGKIWKGMNSGMIRDSWGSPQKINRVISGNIIKEEWIYRNTWLYLENDVLQEWGPIRK